MYELAFQLNAVHAKRVTIREFQVRDATLLYEITKIFMDRDTSSLQKHGKAVGLVFLVRILRENTS